MKQRVIGAIVLVAIAVIFLPMLLQGPAPEGGAGHVPLDMPEPGQRQFEVRELPLSLPPQLDTVAGSAQPAEVGQFGQQAGDVVAVDADAPVRIDALDDTAASTAAAPVSGTPVAQNSSVDETVSGQPAPTQLIPAARSGGNYAVNLGSYRHGNNAAGLLEVYRQAGLQAYTEVVQLTGQPATRLRLGPFASRGDAEAARLRARELRPDVPAQVIALAAADAPSPSRVAPDTGFVVQVGAFGKPADALTLRDRLRAAGIAAFSEAVATDQGTLHRVRAGPEIDKAAAERLRQQIKTQFQLDGLVVAYP